ncbi:hypothetical protein SASPL_112257 [Salvia splendens]|uniref:Uncharacterized protein n=1 Tax=Salvia splendens TaxID=180675 RepID=A0A8X9A5X2_SALSN|nr:hypothetical protein SASPL_112257 [Salvia splendens]
MYENVNLLIVFVSDCCSMGLDLVKAGVIEPAMCKVKIIQTRCLTQPFMFATEAVITILRIDDMIKLFKDESLNGED